MGTDTNLFKHNCNVGLGSSEGAKGFLIKGWRVSRPEAPVNERISLGDSSAPASPGIAPATALLRAQHPWDADQALGHSPISSPQHCGLSSLFLSRLYNPSLLQAWWHKPFAISPGPDSKAAPSQPHSSQDTVSKRHQISPYRSKSWDTTVLDP